MATTSSGSCFLEDPVLYRVLGEPVGLGNFLKGLFPAEVPGIVEVADAVDYFQFSHNYLLKNFFISG